MKPSPSISLQLALLLFSATTIFSCHVDDEHGLLGFKSGITHDPSGKLASWIPGTDCCRWEGLTCSDGNRINQIFFTGTYNDPNDSMSGTISNSLSKLRYLSYIQFINLQYISGEFPEVIFRLPRLRMVLMTYNNLSGPLPRDIGNLTKLEELWLDGNRFTGPIPTSISKLKRLSQLSLNQNFLSGGIPDGIRRLKKLTSLNLAGNQLSGSIPDFFDAFTELHDIKLSDNKLSGDIPASVSALSKGLWYFEVGNNALTGQIPSFFGNFSELMMLNLSWNRFSGSVPGSFENMVELSVLDLSHNALVDPFPVLNKSKIGDIDLSYNQFHLGKIPGWITSAFLLSGMKLAKCGIEMRLESLNLTNPFDLYSLDLSENEISGSPVTLFNRTNALFSFRASGNKLKFNMRRLKIPEHMEILDLSRNLVFGKVSKVVARIKNLNVSYNHLCGRIPTNNLSAKAFLGNKCLCGPPLQPCKQ